MRNPIKRLVKPVIKKVVCKIAGCVQWLNNYQVKTNSDIFEANLVEIPPNFNINGLISITNVAMGGKIKIGNYFSANSGQHENPIGGDTILRLCVDEGASMTIGNNVGISNSTIVCCNRVTIEDYVMIGGGCRVWDSNFHSLNPIVRTCGKDKRGISQPVTIGAYAFIGGGSIIMKGVSIGKNTVIAAGSVVMQSIPDNVIAGGNPCKVLAPLRMAH